MKGIYQVNWFLLVFFCLRDSFDGENDKNLIETRKFSIKIKSNCFKNGVKWHSARKSSKKNRWSAFSFFFFIFMKVQVEKSLSLPGKKIKFFIIKDMARNRKKRFLDLFWWIFTKKNKFFTKLIILRNIILRFFFNIFLN